MKPFNNLGLNVTTDNFFTNKHLGDYLVKRRTTLVGTCRSNKTFIPNYSKRRSNYMSREQSAKRILHLPATSRKTRSPSTCTVLSTKMSKFSTMKSHCLKLFNCTTKTRLVSTWQIKCWKRSVKGPSRRWTFHTFYNIIDMVLPTTIYLNRKQ